MIPGERASNQFTAYRMVGPENPPSGFPKRFAQTTAWSPGSIELKLTGESQRTWQLVTDLPYNIDRHVSIGIAPGRYQLGSAMRTKVSGWSGDITGYLREGNNEWVPAEPSQTAKYELILEITEADAAAIKAFEMEHVDDIAYAWDCSFGMMGRLLSKLSGADNAEALGLLVDQLISSDAGYLIPATPLDVGAWGTRVRLVYNLLCDHSGKRDERREHSPVRRRFEVDANRIIMRVIMGALHPKCAEYVKPEEIPLAFSAPRFEKHLPDAEESVQQKLTAEQLTPVVGPLPVNTQVVWSVDTTQLRLEPPQGLEVGEIFIHATPAITPEPARDENWIIGALKYSHGNVVAHDGTYAWVKVGLLEEPYPDDPDDRGSPGAAGTKLGADEGYVRLRGSLLKEKNS